MKNLIKLITQKKEACSWLVFEDVEEKELKDFKEGLKRKGIKEGSQQEYEVLEGWLFNNYLK